MQRSSADDVGVHVCLALDSPWSLFCLPVDCS